MVGNELGACEWFVWDLRRSGLIERSTLDQLVSDYLKTHPRAEAPALAEHLVQQGLLTAFQAERILNGKSQGLVLGPYVLLEAIGSGSMGQVYKAASRNDQRLYAVKVLPRRSMWNVRLARRQVRAFQGFQHPAVVPFLDVGTAGGLHYLVWPLVEGTPLDRLVQEQGPLPANRVALIGKQIALGLSVCHQNHIFHGLIKPSNIMIAPQNQVHILDFGIGSLLVENDGESLVDTMSTANTLTSGLDCASPESILDPSNRTPAGDQYSLGCVLYFCLTGRVPFAEGSAVEKMMAHQTKEPQPIRALAPHVPAELEAVVARLMAKKPELRFGDCEEVAEALEPFIGDLRQIPGGAPTLVHSPLLSQSSGRLAGLGSHPSNTRPGLSSERPVSPAGATAPGLPHTPTPPAQPGMLPSSSLSSPLGTPIPTRPATPAPERPAPGNSPLATPGRAAVPLRSSLSQAPQQLPTPPAAVRSAPLLPGRSILGLQASRSSAQLPTDVPAAAANDVPWAIEDGKASGGRMSPWAVVAMAIVLTVLAYFGTIMLFKQ